MPATKIKLTQIEDIILNASAVANATNEGRFRYWKDSTFSYLEVCMASNGTYEWILISQQEIL